jgi:cysteine desulfurase / selenocysteine lyase
MAPLNKTELHASELSDLENFPRQFRSLFPITENYVYMNHASIAPLSTGACAAMAAVLDKFVRNVPRVTDELNAMQSLARERAATLVNAQPDEIAFLRNTSEALSIIANGVEWHTGDNIVTAAAEFPANLYPWKRLEAAYGVEVRCQSAIDGWVDADELLALVDGRTRLVAVSWVQFATGQRLYIRRIGRLCREREILFVVDAVQGLGALRLDVENDFVDAFAAGAQKFLLGPKGVSLLYVSNRILEQIRPTVVGWTAVKNYEDYLPHDLNFRDGAVRFEGGTTNVPGIAGLSEALDLFLKAGPAQIERHLLSLNSYLSDALVQRGYRVVCPRNPKEASAILVCEHDRFSGDELWALLDSQNIITSARLGRLRIAPHFYNTKSDADALIAALPS